MTTTKKLPRKVQREIHMRAVDAFTCNMIHAESLHPDAGVYALCNHLDIAIQGWLLHSVRHEGHDPTEAVDDFLGFLTEVSLPSFFEKMGLECKATVGTARSLENMAEQILGMIESAEATKQ